MKKHLIILGLLIFLTELSFAYEKVYLQRKTSYPTYQNYYTPYGYNNYGYNNYRYNYYNPYAYQGISSQDAKRIRRARILRRINRNIYNNLTWNFNKNQNGALTGYSVPVTKDSYQQMGISPYDPKNKTNSAKTPNCNYDLFSSPQGNETYYSNGEKKIDLGGIQGKTGVTIIYD